MCEGGLTYKHILMTLSTPVDLLGEFHKFSDQVWHEEDTLRMLRFHLRLSQHSHYLPNIKQTLHAGLRYSHQLLLLFAEYLAYLVHFQHLDLERERSHFANHVAKGLFQSEAARNCYAMLAEPRDMQGFVRGAKRQIEEMTSVTNLQQLMVKLDILGRSLMWELKKNIIARFKPTPGMQDFMDQLMMGLLCIKKYGEKEEILAEIAHITRCAIEYLQEDALIYKKMLTQLLESWLTLKIYKQPVRREVMRTLTASLKVFGIYKPVLFEQLLSSNTNMVDQIDYIELLDTFLDKRERKQVINRTEATKIFKALFTALIKAPTGTTNGSYRSKALMFDQILKLLPLINYDQSTKISQSFGQAQNKCHEAFIWSLRFIFNRNNTAATIQCVQTHKLKYLEKTKQEALYERTLERYCQDELGLQEFIINPELKDDFLWEILLLRTTIATNYGALCQIGKIVNLIINLTKIMLLDIFPEECLEIIQKLLKNETVFALQELQDISFSGIIESVKPILMRTVQNQRTNDCESMALVFHNFGRVVKMITQLQEVSELTGQKLFLSLIRLSNELHQRFTTKGFIKYQSELLELAMPTQLGQIIKEKFQDCIYQLFVYVQRFQNVLSFLLYLEMMMRTIAYPQMREFFLQFHQRISQIIQSQPVNVVNAYNIAYFILSDSAINKEVLDQSWTILSDFASFQYPQLFFTIMALQQYAAGWVVERCGKEDQEQFLLYQLMRGEQVLVQMDELQAKTVLFLRLEEILTFRQSLLMFLQEMLMRYIEIEAPIFNDSVTINGYLFRAYQNMKSNRPPPSVFEQSPAICQYWCKCQMLVLIMVASTLRKQKAHSGAQIIDSARQIDGRSEWVRMLYPKGQEQDQFKEFYLRLNLELYGLKNIADRKFRQLYVL